MKIRLELTMIDKYFVNAVKSMLQLLKLLLYDNESIFFKINWTRVEGKSLEHCILGIQRVQI